MRFSQALVASWATLALSAPVLHPGAAATGGGLESPAVSEVNNGLDQPEGEVKPPTVDVNNEDNEVDGEQGVVDGHGAG